MKKLVWSETHVTGGQPFTGSLPQPPAVTGPFQSVCRAGSTASFYADTAVIAYREPETDQSAAPARVTSSGAISISRV